MLLSYRSVALALKYNAPPSPIGTRGDPAFSACGTTSAAHPSATGNKRRACGRVADADLAETSFIWFVGLALVPPSESKVRAEGKASMHDHADTIHPVSPDRAPLHRTRAFPKPLVVFASGSA